MRTEQHQKSRAGTPEGTVLIIGDSMSPPSQQRLASQIPGATVVEAVDLRDLVNFASTLDLQAADAVLRSMSAPSASRRSSH